MTDQDQQAAATTGSSSLPPAGWYDDPDAPGVRRYWDGRNWTDSRVTTEGIPYQPVPPRRRSGRPVGIWPAAIAVVLGGLGLWFAQTFKPSAANALGLNGNSFYLKPATYHALLVVSVILIVLGALRLLTALFR